MNFKIDENLPIEAADLLREAGHDAVTVAVQRLGGGPDSDVVRACRQEKRALVTLDLDFADIRTYPPADSHGVIVLRLRKQDKVNVLTTLRRLLTLLQQEPLERRLWIADGERTRIRE